MYFSLFAVQEKEIDDKGGCDLLFSRVILSFSHTGLVVADTLCDDLHLYSASFCLLLYLFFLCICMYVWITQLLEFLDGRFLRT